MDFPANRGCRLRSHFTYLRSEQLHAIRGIVDKLVVPPNKVSTILGLLEMSVKQPIRIKSHETSLLPSELEFNKVGTKLTWAYSE